MLKKIQFYIITVLIIYTGCKSINSPFLSKEEKFKIALHEYQNSSDWKVRNENWDFLLGDKEDIDLLFEIVKQENDFKTLDLFAADTMRRWNDTRLFSYLIKQLEQGKIQINAKSSACRELILDYSGNYYLCFPTSASLKVRSEELRLYLKFAKLTDKHFFGINEKSYLSNRFEIAPQLLLNIAQKALLNNEDRLFGDVISEIKQDYFNSKIEKSANFGIHSPYPGSYIYGSLTISSLISSFAEIHAKSCAGICAASLEASYWMKHKKSEKALKMLVESYIRAKKENIVIDEVSIEKALIEYVKENRYSNMPSVDSHIYLRRFAMMSPDFRIICMIMYLEKELENQKEVENWSDILEDNWGLAVKETLFPELVYEIKKNNTD